MITPKQFLDLGGVAHFKAEDVRIEMAIDAALRSGVCPVTVSMSGYSFVDVNVVAERYREVGWVISVHEWHIEIHRFEIDP